MPDVEARSSLRLLLEQRQVLAGRLQMDDVWPAVETWGKQAFGGDDLLLLYAASLPAGGQGFAGEPPHEVAGQPLWCVMVARGGEAAPSAAHARLTLWFSDFSRWSSFQAADGFIDIGHSTPHLDWALGVDERESGLGEWHRDPLLEMARALPVVGLTLVDGHGRDELAVVHRAQRF